MISRFDKTIRRVCWLALTTVVLALTLCSCQHRRIPYKPRAVTLSDTQVAVLDRLKNEINLTYGFENGWPRIDRGPCGRFAKLFREEWNDRFKQKINIAFIMITNGGCDHVLVRLPDGSYYDGGNGVISGSTLLREFRPGDRLEEMTEFDLNVLDQRSYGLKRTYELCPNYSDEVTGSIIAKYLAQIPRD